jgi:hypothetical protein
MKRMKPEDVPDDLMNGGREALLRWRLGTKSPTYIPTFEEQVRVVLATVIPEIEKRMRAQLADEIEAERLRDDDGSSWGGGMARAAQIARGEAD